MTVSVCYSTDYTLAGHSFDTTRKARWIAESLAADPIEGITLVEPAPLTDVELAAVHDSAYVRAVRTGEPRRLAESNYFPWDEGLWTMVCATTGGAVQAALTAYRDKAVSGSLSSGLHHAKRDHGDGFCTFNGLALAARAVFEADASSILIIDLDAHCGGGTFQLLRDEPRVESVDIAVSVFDRYRPTDRMTLDVIDDPAKYLPTLIERLAVRRDQPFDLVLYNAGMDPFERCDVGGLRGITAEILAERERIVFSWCQDRKLPVAFVMAGGYTNSGFSQAELVELHPSDPPRGSTTALIVEGGA